MKRIIHLCLISIFFFCTHSSAQKEKKYNSKVLVGDESELLDNAEFYFSEKNYTRALPLFLIIDEAHPEEHYFKYMAGQCCISIDLERKNAIKYLTDIENTENAYIKRNIFLYLGKAYHINNEYERAIDYFNKQLAVTTSVADQLLIKQYIEQCKNGEKILKDKIVLEVHNIGSEINSSASEYVPLITSDGSVIIFTYRGSRSLGGLMDYKLKADLDGIYYEDIFISNNVGGHWLYPTGIADNINTKGHDASIAFSSDGQTLFIFKSTPKDNGDIFVSKLVGDLWSDPVRLGKNINTEFWEGSCSLSSDEMTLYFSSERPGGIGGKDLWVSQWENGDWGVPKNLGPSINTPYNDDAPFIHPDGVTLFFSSEGHNSMGGYDIMFSKFQKDDTWSTPENIGMPINSAGDERYYVLSADGESGFFSSDREGGFGEQDIYRVTPAIEGDPPPLALLLGTVMMDDKPIGATINVKNITTGVDGRKHNANSLTGKYLLALTPGNDYKIAIEVEGANSNIQYLDIKGLDTYVKVEQNIPFYTEEYKKANNITEEEGTVSLQKTLNEQVTKFKEESNTEYYEANKYNEVLKKYGDETKEGVTFQVELGTYENPDDFDPKKYADLGKISKRIDNDGNVTYSIGSFKTLLDAEIFKYKVINADTNNKKNIVVTTNDNGERKIIQEYKAADYKKNKYSPLYPQTIKSQSLISLNDNKEYNNLVKDKGAVKIDGLSYKLEIGTFADTNEFHKLGLDKYGPINKKVLSNGSTRYTIGEFQTLAEADEFRKKVAEENSNAAKSFVTVFYFEEKQSVKEFFDSNIVAKTATAKVGTKQTKTTTVAKANTKTSNSNSVAKTTPAAKQDYPTLVKDKGSYQTEGLTYKVNVGSFTDTSEFNALGLEKYGKVEKKVAEDGTISYSVGEFKTLAEADAFQKKIAAENPKVSNSLVKASYKDEEHTVPELFNSGIIKKTKPKENNNTPTITASTKNKTEKSKKTTPPLFTPENIIVTAEITAEEKQSLAQDIPCDSSASTDFSFFVGKSLNDPQVYSKLIATAGGLCVDGLKFTVQIGAYRLPQNFKYQNLTVFGNADIRDYPDGVTRFTMKEFDNIKEADVFRQIVMQRGTRDAWITAWYNGKRITLEELIPLNFYGRAIN